MPAQHQSHISFGAACSAVLSLSLTTGVMGAGIRPHAGTVSSAVRTCGWAVVSSAHVNAAERYGLVAVAAVSPRDVWTVGSSTEHWNGSSWSVYTPARTENDQQLTAISAISSKELFLVGGDSYFSGPGRALIDRFDGDRWRKVYSPKTNPLFGPKVDLLNAVSGSSSRNVWAAGGQPVSDGEDQAYILHWNGHKWVGTTLPDDGGIFPDELYGVAAVSSRYVLVVGNGGYSAVWNGKQWTTVPSPVFANAITALSKNDAWAVGSGPAGAIEHWNGVKWTPSPLALPAGWSPDLASVSAAGPDDVWAVGQAYRVTATHRVLRTRALVAHWNGTDWALVPTPTLSGTIRQLTGVSSLPNGDAWAVGRYGRASHSEVRPLIEHYVRC